MTLPTASSSSGPTSPHGTLAVVVAMEAASELAMASMILVAMASEAEVTSEVEVASTEELLLSSTSPPLPLQREEDGDRAEAKLVRKVDAVVVEVRPRRKWPLLLIQPG